MASHDRGLDTGEMRSAADARLSRNTRLDWSALFGGSLIGWGALFLLSLVAMIIGWPIIDPFTSRATSSNLASALWGAGSAVVASFIGGYAVVYFAGDRRRSESLMHGAVAWAMSLLLASFIALFASGLAPFTRTTTRNVTSANRGHAALIETTRDGNLLAVFSTAGALLALVGSMLGGLAAASKSSGLPFADEFRLHRRGMNGHRDLLAENEQHRQQTTIIPPTH